MKQNKHTFKALGLFLSLFMLTTVFTGNLVRKQVLAENQTQTNDDQDEQKAHFTEFSSDYVIPSFAFDFGSDFVLVPAADFAVLLIENTFKAVSKPVYRISYFEKLFEHHIAINAP
jgi:hypothetical protein